MHPVGFVNTGTLCYLNSMLQSLIGCDIFNKFLVDNERNYVANNLIMTYIGIIKKTRYLTDDNVVLNDNITMLRHLISKLNSNSSNFGYSQEDAGECFLLFLGAVDDKHIDKLFNHTYKCDVVCLNCNITKSVENDISCQFDIFNYDKFTNIANHIKYNKTILSGYECASCKQSDRMYKVNRLIDLPQIIIINFNKYYNKYETDYPDFISFKKENTDDQYITYKLKSIITHYGRMTGGHYTAKSIRNGVPYLFNDSQYSNTDMTTSSNTYILMYTLDTK